MISIIFKAISFFVLSILITGGIVTIGAQFFRAIPFFRNYSFRTCLVISHTTAILVEMLYIPTFFRSVFYPETLDGLLYYPFNEMFLLYWIVPGMFIYSITQGLCMWSFSWLKPHVDPRMFFIFVELIFPGISNIFLGGALWYGIGTLLRKILGNSMGKEKGEDKRVMLHREA